MTAFKPRIGIRVVSLREGAEPRPPLPELLATHRALQYVGSFDIVPAPFERVRTLQPDVVILQLPMSELNVLRWINYLRTGLDHCAILVTGPRDLPYDQHSVIAYGADEFIPQHRLARRLVQTIVALSRKQHHFSPVRRDRARFA
jgi:DNA-binding NarL/FixJ family response regulator